MKKQVNNLKPIIMKTTLDKFENCSFFGNKGMVWSDQTHLASKGSLTLCGTPMLSTNWVGITMREEKKEFKICPKCLLKYEGIEEIQPLAASYLISNFMFFMMNYNHNWIEECWKNDKTTADHLREKYSSIYKKVGSHQAPFDFWFQLDDKNRDLLLNYIDNTYSENKPYQLIDHTNH